MRGTGDGQADVVILSKEIAHAGNTGIRGHGVAGCQPGQIDPICQGCGGRRRLTDSRALAIGSEAPEGSGLAGTVPMSVTLQPLSMPYMEVVYLTSFGGQNKPPVRDRCEHSSCTTSTRASAVFTASFCCYHEHYHVGEKAL